jgi:hypothetical protein
LARPSFSFDLNHDYFVGETGFLVHNSTCSRCGSNIHHIVAQNAGAAGPAQAVLGVAGIGINSAINKVELSTCFHQRLHFKEYYQGINEEILAAGPDGAAQTLGELGDLLQNLDMECECPIP